MAWSEEWKAAWREKVRATNNKPASGIPAQGHGWGGNSYTWRNIGPDGKPPVKLTPEQRAKFDKRALKLMEKLGDIGEADGHPQQVHAINSFHNRLYGQPKAEVENTGEQTIVIKTGVPRANRD